MSSHKFIPHASLKILLLLFGLSLPPGVCFGQLAIRGTIKDRQQNLPSVTVLLLNLDSAVMDGGVTDSIGEFVIENVVPGRYLISASMVGYTKYLSASISVENKDVVVPEIILEDVPVALNEVVIKAERQLFEQSADRLVINLESSITSSGNTILEVLQKSPGIVVNRQNNSITLNGKSGARVMINEKLMQVPLDVVIQMLDGMSASNIEKIELITTPPAKYDADGNAGIIHIVTKTNEDFGTRGSMGFTLGFRWAETLGGNFNVSHRNKNFAYFLDYSILRNHNLHIMKIARQLTRDDFDQTVNVVSHRKNVTTQQNLAAGFEWKLNNKTLINVGLTGYKRDWSMTALLDDHSRVTKDSTINTTMNIRQSNVWLSATAAIGIQTKINAKSEIGFSLDYLHYHNDNPSFYDNKIFYEEHNLNEISKTDLQKKTPIQFLIGKVDYQHQLSDAFTFEVGAKAVTSKFNNDVLVQRAIDDMWEVDPLFTSHSMLREQVGAVYVSTNWRPVKKWQVNSGLRYEHTFTSIHNNLSRKNSVKRNYGYLFPTLFLKKEIGPEKDVQLSYSRRITRPTYNDIASYSAFWSPNTFTAENTSLWPAISDAIKVGYHLRQWTISLQMSQVEREITSLQPEIDYYSNTLTYRSQNLKHLKTLSLNNFYSFSLASWWEVQSNVSAQYQVAQTSHLQHNVTLSLYGLNVSLVNVLKLPKDFSIEISGMYQSKSLAGITQLLPAGTLNAGIQKNLHEKGIIRLAMDDILYTNNERRRSYSLENNLDLYFNYNWHNQFIRLSYTRNLGNSKLRSIKWKSGSEEERKRISN
jgi:hypothetical protein